MGKSNSAAGFCSSVISALNVSPGFILSPGFNDKFCWVILFNSNSFARADLEYSGYEFASKTSALRAVSCLFFTVLTSSSIIIKTFFLFTKNNYLAPLVKSS